MHDEFPEYRGELQYFCLGCGKKFPADELFYTCPECKGVFLLEDKKFDQLKEIPGNKWQEIFDERAKTKKNALRGIFRYYELIAPVVEEEDIVYLGEGHTPIIASSPTLTRIIGQPLAYKNDGQNPSASFKDRGMACAFSYLRALVRRNNWEHILTICASTGDTSASAALYAAYVGDKIKSVVLLPQGKVTAQQLAQPLGSGAMVLEIPGVFDDCMKVVEYLADNFRVALLNSKNAWRILGQESYPYEVAQWYDWDLKGKVVFIPVGNAGNITALMNGFLKLKKLNIINELPRIVGVQSSHADPVFKYYAQESEKRQFVPVKVTPSVAQAAMIGNPVSFPRVKSLASEYERVGGPGVFNIVQVEEQEIIEGMLLANRHGHIACTQGGECLAGLIRAKEAGLMDKDELAILDATAHSLKFISFQQMYFEDSFPPAYEIRPKKEFINTLRQVLGEDEKKSLSDREFTLEVGNRIVEMLGLSKKEI